MFQIYDSNSYKVLLFYFCLNNINDFAHLNSSSNDLIDIGSRENLSRFWGCLESFELPENVISVRLKFGTAFELFIGSYEEEYRSLAN